MHDTDTHARNRPDRWLPALWKRDFKVNYSLTLQELSGVMQQSRNQPETEPDRDKINPPEVHRTDQNKIFIVHWGGNFSLADQNIKDK